MNIRLDPVLTTLTLALLAAAAAPQATPTTAAREQPAAAMNLADLLGAGRLRGVNREVTRVDGRADAVQVNATKGSGVVWIEGTDFATGTIEVEIRGRDVFQASFVGVAFGRLNDDTHETVYLRPFNFRAEDPVRRQHAVQYVSVPEYDWPRLRKEFPEEFENPVDASIEPTGWVPLRVVVRERQVQVYVGAGAAPALEVRRLGTPRRGMIGLWAGNTSDGAFANLRITPAP